MEVQISSQCPPEGLRAAAALEGGFHKSSNIVTANHFQKLYRFAHRAHNRALLLQHRRVDKKIAGPHVHEGEWRIDKPLGVITDRQRVEPSRARHPELPVW